MVLIREVQQAARNAPFLKNVEKSESIRDRKTVVLGAMDKQHRGIKLQDVLRSGWVPTTIVIPVGPECAVELRKVLAKKQEGISTRHLRHVR